MTLKKIGVVHHAAAPIVVTNTAERSRLIKVSAGSGRGLRRGDNLIVAGANYVILSVGEFYCFAGLLDGINNKPSTNPAGFACDWKPIGREYEP